MNHLRSIAALSCFLATTRLRAQMPLSFMLYDPAPEVLGHFGVDVQIADLDGDGVGEVIVGAEG
ncbi:MAG: FG-GAP repeat protein [Planctomycetota bacterium]